MQVDINAFNTSYNDLSNFDNKTQWIQFTANAPAAIVKPNWGKRIINHIKCLIGLGDGPAKIAKKVEQFFRDNINHMTAKHIAGIANIQDKLFAVMKPDTRTAFNNLIKTVALKVEADNKAVVDAKEQQIVAMQTAHNAKIDQAKQLSTQLSGANGQLTANNAALSEELERTKKELESVKSSLRIFQALRKGQELSNSGPITFRRKQAKANNLDFPPPKNDS